MNRKMNRTIKEQSELKLSVEYKKKFAWGRYSIVPTITVTDGGLCPRTEIFAGKGNWHITFDNGASNKISTTCKDLGSAEKWVAERISEVKKVYTEATKNRNVVLPSVCNVVIPR